MVINRNNTIVVDGKRAFNEPHKHNTNTIGQSIHLTQYLKGVELLNQNIDLANRGQLPNVISVSGKRGSGKTSFITNINHIIYDNHSYKEVSNGAFFIKERLKCLDIIDPTKFSANTNILEIVISTILKEVIKPKPNYDGEMKTEIVSNLISKVTSFQELMPYMNDGAITDEYVIDKIVDMKEILNLNLKFQDIVDSYLKYISNDIRHLKENYKKLVIIIDDLDLKTDYAYTMLEQIRKVMLTTNVLIIITSDFTQLENVLWETMSKKFQTALQKEVVSVEDVTEMVERYVEKLLPISDRIYLKNIVQKQTRVLTKEVSPKYLYSLDQMVRQFFYLKLNLALPKKTFDSPYAFDKLGLRSVLQLIDLLVNYPDVSEKGEIDKQLLVENVSKFYEYFIHDFAKGLLSLEQYQMISKWQELDVYTKNYFLCDYLEKHTNENRLKVKENQLEKVMGEVVKSYNVSTFDVIRFLENYYANNPIEGDFVFVVQLLMSLNLKEGFGNTSDSSSISDYHILVGGDYFGINNSLRELFHDLYLNAYIDFIQYIEKRGIYQTESLHELFLSNLVSIYPNTSNKKFDNKVFLFDSLAKNVTNELEILEKAGNNYRYSPFTFLFKGERSSIGKNLTNYWEIRDLVLDNYNPSRLTKNDYYRRFDALYRKLLKLDNSTNYALRYNTKNSVEVINTLDVLREVRQGNPEEFDLYFNSIFQKSENEEYSVEEYRALKTQKLTDAFFYFDQAMDEGRKYYGVNRAYNIYFGDTHEKSIKEYLKLKEMKLIDDALNKLKEKHYANNGMNDIQLSKDFFKEIMRIIGEYVL